MDGLLVVDKPSGITSHDVVARVRRALRETRIGHTGTLDPMATGVLLLVVGKATRLATFLSGSDKSYEAVVRFGFATDTADADGRPVGPVHNGPMPSRDAIEAALEPFRGTFMQQPPAFSAKKIAGQRSYKLARARAAGHLRRTPGRGRESNAVSATADPQDPQDRSTQKLQLTPDPCQVSSYRVEIAGVGTDTVTLTVECSAGFYIRSLAHDLGERLGIGAHLTALRRGRVGDFDVDRAIRLETAEREPQAAVSALVPLADMLPHFPTVVLTAEGVNRAVHGREIGPGEIEQGLRNGDSGSAGSGDCGLAGIRERGLDTPIRMMDQAGRLVAIGRRSAAAGLLHPSVVLV